MKHRRALRNWYRVLAAVAFAASNAAVRAEPPATGQNDRPADQPQQQAQQSDQSSASQPQSGPTAPPPAPPSFKTAGPWSFTAVLTADTLADVAGGLHPGVKGLTKTALSAAYDGAADGHDGWSGLASLQYVRGGHLSGRNVGDVQGVTNIEAFNALRVYELWMSKDYDGSSGWKAGLIDLNVDFDIQNVASFFINSSDGVGPEFAHSGVNGPSIFPTTAIGLTGYIRPDPSVTIRLGLFDGTAGSPAHPGAFAIRLSGKDGVLAIAQAEKRYESGFRIEGGAWTYSAFFDALHRFGSDGRPLRYQRSRGAYATAEGPLFTDPSDGDRNLAGWVRIGVADPVVQRISGYLGGGLVYSGLIASRPKDQVGIAVNHAVVDQPGLDRAAHRSSSETTFEMSYRYDAADWLVVQPDTQLVIQPNGDPRIAPALVAGVRFTITLTRTLLSKIKATDQ